MAFEADTTQDIMRRVFDATLYALSQSSDRTQVFTATLQSAANADGNGTSFDLSGLGTIAMQVLITGAGTTQVNFEVTVDNTNWTSIKGTTVPSTSSLASTTIASGVFQFDVSAFSQFRARISSTVGVVSVTVIAAGVAIGTGSLSSETDTELETDDLDTGAGTDTQAIVGVALAESGGHTLLGSAKPMPLIAGQTSITGAAGAVAANTPRVTHASDDPVTVALQIMDDWDESDRAKVSPIVGQTGVAAGAGAVGVTVPRTTLASDDPAVAALQIIDDWDESDRAKTNPIVGQAGIAAGTGIDGATVPRVSLATNVPLPTGSNAIGKLAANSGVDIGDVDITSLPQAASVPYGVVVIAATATAQQLPTNTAKQGVIVVANELNDAANIVYLGFSNAVTNTAYFKQLLSGEATPLLPVTNSNVIWVYCVFTGGTHSYNYAVL